MAPITDSVRNQLTVFAPPAGTATQARMAVSLEQLVYAQERPEGNGLLEISREEFQVEILFMTRYSLGLFYSFLF